MIKAALVLLSLASGHDVAETHNPDLNTAGAKAALLEIRQPWETHISQLDFDTRIFEIFGIRNRLVASHGNYTNGIVFCGQELFDGQFDREASGGLCTRRDARIVLGVSRKRVFTFEDVRIGPICGDVRIQGRCDAVIFPKQAKVNLVDKAVVAFVEQNLVTVKSKPSSGLSVTHLASYFDGIARSISSRDSRASTHDSRVRGLSIEKDGVDESARADDGKDHLEARQPKDFLGGLGNALLRHKIFFFPLLGFLLVPLVSLGLWRIFEYPDRKNNLIGLALVAGFGPLCIGLVAFGVFW
jgi:hypothetical protein